MSDIGWKFPPTGGGQEDGFNDAGIHTFADKPHLSLAREIIQNSLDAQADVATQVEVHFQLRECDPKLIGGKELRKIFRECEKLQSKGSVPQKFFARGEELLGHKHVPIMVISDKNTSGLQTPNWNALVRQRGTSEKSQQSAGGSFGIGKHAAFAVSNLRTVFYWTYYIEGEEEHEKMQGKALLVSHGHEADKNQGTGYWGYKEKCRELEGGSIPAFFRNPIGKKIQGTTIYIAGFKRQSDWEIEMAKSIVSNYFPAILQEKLIVHISPGKKGKYFRINRHEIDKLFEDLISLDDESTDIRKAKVYCDMLRGNHVERLTYVDEDLGECQLLIRTSGLSGMPVELLQRVGFVRNPGMLVTDEQERLKRFPGIDDFLALFVCDTEEGNRFLRSMENPAHNQFHTDRLPDSKKKKGTKTWNSLLKWIKEKINSAAGRPQRSVSEMIAELAEYLPDTNPDDDFPDVPKTEPDFDGPPQIGAPSPMVAETVDDPDSSNNDNSTPPTKKTIQISNTRVLPSVERDIRKRRIFFTPHFTGKVKVSVHLSGDTGVTPETIGQEVELDVEKDRRTIMHLEALEPIDGSLFIRAVKVQ